MNFLKNVTKNVTFDQTTQGAFKVLVGGPGPHPFGPMLLWCRPGHGKPLFWPLGTGIPQQTTKKGCSKGTKLEPAAEMAGRDAQGAWKPQGPWAEPALALGNPLTHNQDKKVH